MGNLPSLSLSPCPLPPAPSPSLCPSPGPCSRRSGRKPWRHSKPAWETQAGTAALWGPGQLGDRDPSQTGLCPAELVATLAPGCGSSGSIPLLGAVGALHVIQDPREVQVAPGDSVALECQVLLAEHWDLLRLEWTKDGEDRVLCGTRLNSTSVPLSPCGPRLQLAWHQLRATLRLQQARGEDAGLYLCQVTQEIPQHLRATGNGTRLLVTTGLLWGLGGALGGTALLVLLGCIACRCSRRDSDSDIYLNMMPLAVQPPRKLVPSENCLYQEGLQLARGPPPAPQPCE
ncbi:transmembrane and immunoglobulin domain-containing protein 2 [Porphyrio hochstetteri]